MGNGVFYKDGASVVNQVETRNEALRDKTVICDGFNMACRFYASTKKASGPDKGTKK